MLFIVAVGCPKYAPLLGYIKCKSKLFVSSSVLLKSLSVFITVVEEAEELVTRPAICIFVSSASCTNTTSPTLKAPPFIPVLKVITSFSSFSVSKCHLPNLCACPCEVQPNAVIALLITLPVLAISLSSVTISTACLNEFSGSFQLTFISFVLNLFEEPE